MTFISSIIAIIKYSSHAYSIPTEQLFHEHLLDPRMTSLDCDARELNAHFPRPDILLDLSQHEQTTFGNAILERLGS